MSKPIPPNPDFVEPTPLLVNIDITSPHLSLDEYVRETPMTRFNEARYEVREFFHQFNRFFINRPLIGYSFRRVFYGLVTLLIAIIILFLIVHSVIDERQYLPTGYQSMHLTPEQLEELLINRMKLFGVYGPVSQQLGTYLRNLFPLIPKNIIISQDWGINDAGHVIAIGTVYARRWVYLGLTTSPAIADQATDVMSLFNKAIPYSFAFGSIAVVFSYLIGIPLGIAASRYKGKTSDFLINTSSITLVAIPAVVIVIGIYLLSAAGFGNSILFSSGSFWSKFWPEVVLIIMMTPSTVILTRRYMVDEMTSDYARFALAKGMSERKVYYLHIFRNAGIQILKQFPLDLAVTLFGASILTEQQWQIPGMGRYIVSAVSGNKDPFVILGYVSFASFITIFSSLTSDLFLVYLDPRVKLTRR